MYRAFYFLFFFYSTIPLFSQNQIVIGHVDTIFSKTLEENRKVWIYLPESAKTDKNKRYPIAYLLDGDENFHSFTGIIHQLSISNENKIVPEMIVVAILNTDRTRDLTPNKVVPNEAGQQGYFKSSGGGENFISFIEKELIPFIDRKYPTAPNRTLIGHSLGGLLAIHTLIYHPNIFNNYVAIDPSLSADRKFILQADSVLSSKEFKDKTLFVGVANTKDVGMDSTQAQKDTTSMTEHFRAVLQFCKKRQADLKCNLNFKWKYYPNEGHASVPLIAEYDALHFLFEWYEFSLDLELVKKFQTWPVEDLVKFVKEHYENISKQMGYTVYPPEGLIKELADASLNEGEEYYAKAHAFYKLNIENYPESAGANYSMGNYYLKTKDLKNAQKYFEKSLALKDSEKTRKKLEEIKNNKKKN